MAIPKFIGDDDKDEINPMELLRLVKEYDRNPSTTSFYLFGEARKWWMSMDKDTRWNLTWKNLKISSQINELGIQKWMQCIRFKMS